MTAVKGATVAQELTPTERRLADAMADGLPHTYAHLMSLLSDELADYKALQMHVSRLREKLRASGQDVVCVVHNNRNQYQRVRLLGNPYNGVK